MKECLRCGEMVNESAIRCRCGYSSFKPPRTKSYYCDITLIETLIRQSSVNDTEDEIVYLVDEIARILNNSRTSVSKELIDTIGNNLRQSLVRRKQREEEEVQRKRREEQEEAERKQREEAEREQQLKEAERKQREEAERKQREEAERKQRIEAERERRVLQNNFIHAMETSLPVFRGINDYRIEEEDLAQILTDALNTSLCKSLQIPEVKPSLYTTYEGRMGNMNFWNDALSDRLRQGMQIGLKNFHLLEWIPLAPGRYFTTKANLSRQRASKFIDHKNQEYLPLGKAEMVLGGVGSIRLGVKEIHRRPVYLMCLTSNGVSHQGIPVIFQENQYDAVVNHLVNGGCLVNVVGRLRVYPIDDLPISYDRQIPRYFLYVEHVKVIEPSDKLLVTVAITFADQEEEGSANFRKLWSFCSFDPIRQPVENAVDWLNRYTTRHVRTSVILNDFDEHHQHFDCPIEFSISEIMTGRINLSLLSAYGSRLNLRIVQGDYFDFSHANITNFGGTQVIGKVG